jgi:NAD(P)-dependent dehydrogenase (short-subunit alcohol dehydrogenase family)
VNLAGERALITGGSSGISKALARSLLLKDAEVVISERRLDAL